MELESCSFDDFSLDSLSFDFDKPEENKKLIAAAKLIKRKSSIQKRRIASEKVLAEILPAQISDGESWHTISHGDVDSLSYFAHILKNDKLDYALLSTWCMSEIDAKLIGEYIDSGQIKIIDCYVGEIFPNQYTNAFGILCKIAQKCGGRVAVFRNHSKIFCGKNKRFSFVIESSANINTNPRTEQTAIHASAELFEFYKEFYDGIKSFNRDFDDWQPTQC